MHATKRVERLVRERRLNDSAAETRVWSSRVRSDVCPVCAAGCVRRVAYTSYMPGGIPKSSPSACAVVAHARTRVRACIRDVHTHKRACHDAATTTRMYVCVYVRGRVQSRARSMFDFVLHASPLRAESLAPRRTRVNYAAGRAMVLSHGDVNESATGS